MCVCVRSACVCVYTRVRPQDAKNARQAKKKSGFSLHGEREPQLRRGQTTTNFVHIKIEYNLRDVAFGDVLMMMAAFFCSMTYSAKTASIG